jgi:AmiR/NasT family two-component response regulator
MIHVILVDDDPQFRQNRRAVLEGLGDCIIVLTQFPDEERFFQCIRAGANAYKERAICPEILLETVRRVRAGEFLFSWCSS